MAIFKGIHMLRRSKAGQAVSYKGPASSTGPDPNQQQEAKCPKLKKFLFGFLSSSSDSSPTPACSSPSTGTASKHMFAGFKTALHWSKFGTSCSCATPRTASVTAAKSLTDVNSSHAHVRIVVDCQGAAPDCLHDAAADMSQAASPATPVTANSDSAQPMGDKPVFLRARLFTAQLQDFSLKTYWQKRQVERVFNGANKKKQGKEYEDACRSRAAAAASSNYQPLSEAEKAALLEKGRQERLAAEAELASTMASTESSLKGKEETDRGHWFKERTKQLDSEAAEPRFKNLQDQWDSLSPEDLAMVAAIQARG